MKKEPTSKTVFNIFSNIFFSISLAIISVLITPKIYDYVKNLLNIDDNCSNGISVLLWIILVAIYIFIKESIYVLAGRRLLISTRYKILMSFLSVPATIILHSYLIPFIRILVSKSENFINNLLYERKIIRNR